MAQATTTTDHKAIKRWMEQRGGHPARVKQTGGKDDIGVLRVDFGEPEESLEQISWEEFFKAFEENKLAFLHQEKVEGGKTSRFFKFVRRENSN
jgi:hypothetical protein